MPSYFNSATGFATTVPGDVSVGDDLTVTDDATVADQLLLTETPGSHAATPTVAFGDGDTGLFESADDTLNLVSEGVAVAQVNTGDQLVLLESPGNHAAAPSLAFGDADTGFYESSDDTLVIATGGIGRISTSSSGVAIYNGGFYLQSPTSPSALTGDQTDWHPSGGTSSMGLRIDPGAADRTINSLNLSMGAGRLIYLFNLSTTQTVTLKHDDGATGTATMRFLCPNGVNFVIPTNGTAVVWYDAMSSRWRVIGPVA